MHYYRHSEWSSRSSRCCYLRGPGGKAVTVRGDQSRQLPDPQAAVQQGWSLNAAAAMGVYRSRGRLEAAGRPFPLPWRPFRTGPQALWLLWRGSSARADGRALSRPGPRGAGPALRCRREARVPFSRSRFQPKSKFQALSTSFPPCTKHPPPSSQPRVLLWKVTSAPTAGCRSGFCGNFPSFISLKSSHACFRRMPFCSNLLHIKRSDFRPCSAQQQLTAMDSVFGTALSRRPPHPGAAAVAVNGGRGGGGTVHTELGEAGSRQEAGDCALCLCEYLHKRWLKAGSGSPSSRRLADVVGARGVPVFPSQLGSEGVTPAVLRFLSEVARSCPGVTCFHSRCRLCSNPRAVSAGQFLAQSAGSAEGPAPRWAPRRPWPCLLPALLPPLTASTWQDSNRSYFLKKDLLALARVLSLGDPTVGYRAIRGKRRFGKQWSDGDQCGLCPVPSRPVPSVLLLPREDSCLPSEKGTTCLVLVYSVGNATKLFTALPFTAFPLELPCSFCSSFASWMRNSLMN